MLNRAIPPVYQGIQEIEITKAQTILLPNQVPLHLIKAGEQPVMCLEIFFKIAHTEEIKENTVFLVAKMLTEGTKRHTAKQIANLFDQYGASFTVQAGNDRINLTLYCLTKFFAQLLPLIVEILQEASFPTEELRQVKHIALQNLKVSLEKTNYVASRMFYKELFVQFQPYASTIEEASINAIETSDLVEYYQKYIYQQTFDVILTGKITPEIETLVKETFGSFALNPYPTLLTENAIQFNTPTKQIYVEKANSLQSTVFLGKFCVPKAHSDYFNYLILNVVLGGYFGSRLMKNLREEKGYTYGIYAQTQSLERASYSIIRADVTKKSTADALQEIYKEIKQLQDAPINTEELTRVKNYMLGSFANMLSTSFDLSEVFKGIYFHKQDYSFYQRYIKAIHQITPEMLQETAHQYFDVNSWLEVVVGSK